MNQHTNIVGRRCDERRGAARRHSAGLAIAVLTSALAMPLGAAGQESPHGFHPIMPGQRLFLRCWSTANGGFELQETPLSVNSVSLPAKMKQRVALPEPWPSLELVEFLPAAMLDQTVVADDGHAGRAAVEIDIEGPKQSMKRWLIADDPERNRLTSLIATWRLMAVTGTDQHDELLRQYKEELTREPRLRVSSPGSERAHEIPLAVGNAQELDDLGCTILVKRFYPHYARDNDAAEPVNVSETRVNPAALVEIRQGESREQRWVFAKFPSFRQQEVERLPFDIILECPVQSSRPVPDFALVAVDRETVEVWTRHDGVTRIRSVSPADTIEIPGSAYEFRIARFVASGRLVESYKSTPKGAPALAVKFPAGDGAAMTMWLSLGKYRTVETPTGPLTIGFDQKVAGASGAHP